MAASPGPPVPGGLASVFILLADLLLLTALLWNRKWPRLQALARKRILSCILLGISCVAVRCALLPFWPEPEAAVYDEFSYLYGADTFASGRLANPRHPLWVFFESAHILQTPAGQSKYPPGQALVLAAAERVVGDPWIGVLLSCGLLCSVMCWALQQWVPPSWALLGAAVFGLRICLASYWMNSYWGGALAAIGGVLAFGAFRRITHRGELRFSWVLAAGIAILSNTRMLEGLVLTAVLAFSLAHKRVLFQRGLLLPLALVLSLNAAWLGCYNFHVTGSALRLPYMEHARQYDVASNLIFIGLSPPPVYRHPLLQKLHAVEEVQAWQSARSDSGIFAKLWVGLQNFYQFAGFALLLPALWFGRELLRDRRTRVPLACIAAAWLLGLAEVWFFPHYLAPVAAATLIVGIQGARHLRASLRLRSVPGRWLACLAVLMVTMCALEAALVISEQKPPGPLETHAAVERALAKIPGQHVVLVAYRKDHDPRLFWVYNRADPDAAPVVWAEDMEAANSQIRDYYPHRTFWRFDPDALPRKLERLP